MCFDPDFAIRMRFEAPIGRKLLNSKVFTTPELF